MKKLLSYIVIVSLLFSQVARGDCDFSKDIKPTDHGTYEYTKDCHIKVGQLVQDGSTKDKQIQDLNQAITLKNLALDTSDKRADNWMSTSLQLQDRVQKIDQLEKGNNILYFALGIAFTSLAVWGAGNLRR